MASLMKAVKLMVVMLAVMASLATLGSACGTGCSQPAKPGSGSGSGGAASGTRTCSPVDIVKLNVCSPLLGGAVAPGCCPLLGLLGVDLELCLCWAVDANVLGLINVDIPKLDIVAKVATSCGYSVPPNFTCP